MPGSVYVMTAVPALIPVTIPLAEPIFATEAFPLVQVPPVTLLVNVPVLPAHIDMRPPIVAGAAFTVTVAVVLHAPTVYVITAVPAATPATIPEEEPTVATSVLPLLQVPPLVASFRDMFAPAQTDM